MIKNYIYKFCLIFYPIIAGLLLIINQDEMVINLYNNNFIINFSHSHKLVGLALTIVTLATNLYSISQNRILEVLIGNLYFTASLICLLAGDFVLMFTALELMMIFATILIFYGNYKNSINAARQYFITHLISGSLILIGISYIITNNSSTEIISLTQLIKNQDSSLIFYCLILLGCLINVAIIPCSGWMVNCYPFATTSGMIYLTSFTSKISVIILLKLFHGLEILKFFGILMIIYGGFYSCIEDNIKRLMCYLTISQLGFMLIAIGINSEQAKLGIIVFIFIHILYKALFGLYIAILMDQENIKYCSEIKSVCSFKRPLLLGSLIISILLITALPPLASFTTKMVVTNALDQDINYYAIFLLKFITCIAIFSTIKYKSLITSFDPKLNILTKLSLFIILASTCIVSFALEKSISLLWSTYPTEILDINWIDIIKQIVIIIAGIGFAIIFNKITTRRSTANINLDLFHFVEKNIRNIYFKYKHSVTNQDNDDVVNDYHILNVIEKNTLHSIKSLNNQSSSLVIVMILLITLTILLIK